jgi:hypothetical protein
MGKRTSQISVDLSHVCGRYCFVAHFCALEEGSNSLVNRPVIAWHSRKIQVDPSPHGPSDSYQRTDSNWSAIKSEFTSSRSSRGCLVQEAAALGTMVGKDGKSTCRIVQKNSSILLDCCLLRLSPHSLCFAIGNKEEKERTGIQRSLNSSAHAETSARAQSAVRLAGTLIPRRLISSRILPWMARQPHAFACAKCHSIR